MRCTRANFPLLSLTHIYTIFILDGIEQCEKRFNAPRTIYSELNIVVYPLSTAYIFCICRMIADDIIANYGIEQLTTESKGVEEQEGERLCCGKYIGH